MLKMIPLLLVLLSALCSVWAAPIHDAARIGDIAAMTKLLTEDPARLEAQEVDGATPLLVAARWGRAAVVRLLLT